MPHKHATKPDELCTGRKRWDWTLRCCWCPKCGAREPANVSPRRKSKP